MSKRHLEYYQMTPARFKACKNAHNIPPFCISCHLPVLVSTQNILVMKSSSNTKYACPECTEKYKQTGVLVYQYPQPNKTHYKNVLGLTKK